jgi:hypothetical protein
MRIEPMQMRVLLGGLLMAAACCATAYSGGGDTGAAKEALQELQEFVGGWKGNGTTERDKTAIWKENATWSWKFKGDDSWLVVEFKDSKIYKSGELRYLTDKKVYQLTMTDKADKSLQFKGTLKKTTLTLDRTDPDTKEGQQLKINAAGGGDRLVFTYLVKPANRTAFNEEWKIGMTREGISLAGGKKGPECIVTGGLGTTMVMYKGTTYYVCCSGCRDAFNENPAKFIAEYEAKKKKQ